MADEPFYSPNRQSETRVAQPGEHVWTLTNGDRRLSCELRDHGGAGCEAQLLRDGEFYKGRHLASRAAALAHVTAVRARLEQEGWTLATPDGPHQL